jgi:hypothetical protein
MANYRKMLSVNAPYLQSLMQLIETQSKETLFHSGQNPYAQTMGPQGKRVYVDPAFAITQARIDYAEGFAAIHHEFRLLLPINKYNYKKYMTFGWQLTLGSDDEKRQAREISSFLDIYENCFHKITQKKTKDESLCAL